MTPLAYKLLGKQFDAMAEVYGTWITPDAHESIRKDGDITTALVNRYPGDYALEFQVKVGDALGVVRFLALYKNSEYLNHVIESTGTMGCMQMHIEALGKLTVFIHKYLELYAKENAFPPENVTY
jgi:hypothetical protein